MPTTLNKINKIAQNFEMLFFYPVHKSFFACICASLQIDMHMHLKMQNTLNILITCLYNCKFLHTWIHSTVWYTKTLYTTSHNTYSYLHLLAILCIIYWYKVWWYQLPEIGYDVIIWKIHYDKGQVEVRLTSEARICPFKAKRFYTISL